MSNNIQHLKSISAFAADRVVRAAVEAASRIEVPSAVAVVDAAGHLSAFTRMDGAAAQATQIAQDKAYTAAGFGIPTSDWHELITQDEPLAVGAPTGIDRFVSFGGGVPIELDGVVIGAIGVSGGHWSQDTVIAEAGVASLI